jgi:hypothetical protein
LRPSAIDAIATTPEPSRTLRNSQFEVLCGKIFRSRDGSLVESLYGVNARGHVLELLRAIKELDT